MLLGWKDLSNLFLQKYKMIHWEAITSEATLNAQQQVLTFLYPPFFWGVFLTGVDVLGDSHKEVSSWWMLSK